MLELISFFHGYEIGVRFEFMKFLLVAAFLSTVLEPTEVAHLALFKLTAQ